MSRQGNNAQANAQDGARVANQPDELQRITVDEAKFLRPGDTLRVPSHSTGYGPARWRVNGAVRTWKRDPERVRVPVKFGLREYGYLDESNIHLFYVEPQMLLLLQERMSRGG